MKVLNNQVERSSDKHGSGAFGASRGSRKHTGVDLVAKKGDKVYTPFAGTITKYGYAYAGDSYRYIEVSNTKYRARLFYTSLDNAHFVGKHVPEGAFLGIAQGIEDRYSGITPHIHFELYSASSTNQNDPIDPTELLKKKV